MRARWRPLPCTCLHYSPKVRSRRSAPPQACYRCCSTPHTCRYTVLARAYPLVALRPIPYNVSFATLLPIGYFSPSLEHLKSQNEPHRRVELAKTSSKSLFFASFGQSTAPLRPAPSFSVLASRTRTFFARLLLPPGGPLSRSRLTSYSSVVAAAPERCVTVFWPLPTRW